jgi:hypothetical protein
MRAIFFFFFISCNFIDEESKSLVPIDTIAVNLTISNKENTGNLHLLPFDSLLFSSSDSIFNLDSIMGDTEVKIHFYYLGDFVFDADTFSIVYERRLIMILSPRGANRLIIYSDNHSRIGWYYLDDGFCSRPRMVDGVIYGLNSDEESISKIDLSSGIGADIFFVNDTREEHILSVFMCFFSFFVLD